MHDWEKFSWKKGDVLVMDGFRVVFDKWVGDDVLVISRYYRRIAKVDKVTKTQIIANNARFRRDSGWQLVAIAGIGKVYLSYRKGNIRC